MIRLRQRVSCQAFVELASDYIDGTLSPAMTATIERHLAGCPKCLTYLEQVRITVRLTGQLRDDDIPDELLAVLRGAWDEHHRMKSS